MQSGILLATDCTKNFSRKKARHWGRHGLNADKTRQNLPNCNWLVSRKVHARHKFGAKMVSNEVWLPSILQVLMTFVKAIVNTLDTTYEAV